MLRNLEIGFGDNTTRTYAKQQTAIKKAEELAGGCAGMVNARVVPVEIPAAPNRYTVLFSCFSDMNDMQFIAREGFHCFA
jgi:hypothetical protein